MLCVCTAQAKESVEVYPGRTWKFASDEKLKALEPKLADAHAYFKELGSTAAMVIQDGQVIAEWGDVSHKSNLHSVRKSLLSALIGIAVKDGKMSLDDSMEKLGVMDVAPELTPKELKATVGDLIKSRSGIYHPTVYETEAMKESKPKRGSHAPGTFWYYNNWDFNALGSIYEKATGNSIFKAFQKYIADPIGMQDYVIADGSYFHGEETMHPAYPMNMSARDLARVALLYLRDGRWKDKQVLPEGWVKASVKPYSDTDRGGGYGYMWWTTDSASGKNTGPLPDGAYWAAGHRGQYAIVVPSIKLIIIHRMDYDLTKKGILRPELMEFASKVISAFKGSKPGA